METFAEHKNAEIEEWRTRLADILHQNALLKYMLSDIVDANQDRNFLPVAEYFQNELLLKDEKLRILLNHVGEVDVKNIDEKNFQNLRREIGRFQKDFNVFFSDFRSKCITERQH